MFPPAPVTLATMATAMDTIAGATSPHSDTDYRVGDRVQINYHKRRLFLNATVTEVYQTSKQMQVRLDADSDSDPHPEVYIVTDRFDKKEVTRLDDYKGATLCPLCIYQRIYL